MPDLNVNTDIAYRAIRENILFGRYQPGATLKAKRLAGEIGVSRTPIRDALRQLEMDGLVVIRPRLGARVKTLEIEEFTALCQMRQALEMYAAGLAAIHRSEGDLRMLRSAVAAMAKILGKLGGKADKFDLIQRFHREDVRFHFALLTAANNDPIRRECTRIHLLDQVLSGELRVPSNLYDDRDGTAQVERSLQEHRVILRAIEKRDAADARRVMDRHLQSVVDGCLVVMQRDAQARRASRRQIHLSMRLTRA